MVELLDALHQPHVQLLLRLVLGGLLLLAGLAKLLDRGSFRAAVAEYEVLPAALERPFATMLPWAETALGALLVLGLGTTAAAALAAPLFLSFVAAIGINLARGRHFDCHCFGAVQSDPIGGTALLRSLLLVTAAIIVAIGSSRFGSLELALFGSSEALPPVAEVIPIVFLAFVIFDVLVLLPELVALRTGLRRLYATSVAGGRHAHEHANGHRSEGPMVEVKHA